MFSKKSSTHDRYITNVDREYYASLTEEAQPKLPQLKDLTTLKSREKTDKQQGGDYMKFNLHLPIDIHSQNSSPKPKRRFDHIMIPGEESPGITRAKHTQKSSAATISASAFKGPAPAYGLTHEQSVAMSQDFRSLPQEKYSRGLITPHRDLQKNS